MDQQYVHIRNFLDGLEEEKRENWLPDSAVSACFKCFVSFSFNKRRHHCRVCGNIFCAACCTNKPIDKCEAGAQLLRMCERCDKLLAAFIEELKQAERRRIYYASNLGVGEDAKSADVSELDCELKRIERKHLLKICKKLCEENGIPEEYETRLTEMTLKAVATVKSSIAINNNIDFMDYVKIKLMPDKDISASRYINGLVFTKNIADRKMKTHIENPKILLISGNLSESKEIAETDTFRDIFILDDYFVQKIMRAIVSIQPSVVVVENSVSIAILEKLRQQDVAVFCNTKPKVMQRLARMTGTTPCPTVDLLSKHLPLGKCQKCFIEGTRRTGKESLAQVDRSYTFFEGCVESAGCTLCVAGTDAELLRRVKTVLRKMLFFGRDLRLESGYLTGMNADWNKLQGNAYLMDAIGIDNYLVANEMVITKLCLHQGELSSNTGITEDIINKKGRKLCGDPAKTSLKCYTNNKDNHFGWFIAGILEVANGTCHLCERKRFTHQLNFYHSSAHVKITTEVSNEGAEWMKGEETYVEGVCKKCRKVVAERKKVEELFEYSLGRFMIQYFYNSTLTNEGGTCKHSITIDMVRKFYYKDLVLSIEYEHNDLYRYEAGEIFLSKMEKAVSVDIPGTSLEVNDKLTNECFQQILSQYEKVKLIIHDSGLLCKDEKVKNQIDNISEWVKKVQEGLLSHYEIGPQEETKETQTDLQTLIIHHDQILKQFYILIELLSKYCEPSKEAARETCEQYNNYLRSVKECLQNGRALLAKSLDAMIAAVHKTYGMNSGIHEDTNVVDHGLIIASAMRTNEYKLAMNEIMKVNKKESNYEKMESELLANNRYCIQLDMKPRENVPTNVIVYKNKEKLELLLNNEPENTMLNSFTAGEKELEDNLTQIVTYRVALEKLTETPALNPNEAPPEEAATVVKRMRQEQQHDSNKVRVSVYHATHFAALRSCLLIDEKEYLSALSNIVLWKNVSGGKAKAIFCKTRNDDIVLKFIKKKERDSFEKYGTQYFRHMCKTIAHQMPSILVRILGLYKVKLENSVTYEIMVMENLCWGSTPTVVYDLKGSKKRRYVKKEERFGGRVLLDTNFKEDHSGEPLILDDESGTYLHKSIHNDTLLLSKMNVMDYSLLAAIDEKNKTVKAGIIDVLREFNNAELLEYHAKRAINFGENPTIIEPNRYKQRFRIAMKRYFIESSTLGTEPAE